MRPCAECPWRRDVEPGQFTRTRFEALEGTRGRRVNERGHDDDAPFGSPFFGCHKSRAGEEFPCAGWLAVEGAGHVGVRLAVANGDVEPGALRPGEGWPDLYADYDEMAAAMGRPEEE